MGATESAEQKIIHAMSSHGESKRCEDPNWKEPFMKFVNNIGSDDHQLATFKTNPRLLKSVLWLLAEKIDEEAIEDELILLLETCIRLLATKGVYQAISGAKLDAIFQAIRHSSSIVRLYSVKVAARIITCPVRDLEVLNSKWQSTARLKFFKSKGCDVLAEILEKETKDNNPSSKEIISRILDILTAVFQDTASSGWIIIRNALRSLKNHHGTLFRLCVGFDLPLRRKALIVTQTVILHSHKREAREIQLEALRSGAWLWLFYQSIDTSQEKEPHRKIFDRESLAEARNLLGLLTDGNDAALAIIRRCLPRAFLMPEILFRVHENQVWFDYGQASGEYHREIESCRWKEYDNIKLPRTNWAAVMPCLGKEIQRPDIIWTNKTKGELLDAIAKETDELDVMTKVSSHCNWDYLGFEVIYPSLAAELRISGLYIRTLLPTLATACTIDPKLPKYFPNKGRKDDPLDFDVNTIPPDFLSKFSHKLCRHIFLEENSHRQLACLQTLTRLLKLKQKSLLPILNQYMGLFTKLASNSKVDTFCRDQTLNLLESLLAHSECVKRFVHHKGIECIMFHITNVHKSYKPLALRSLLKESPNKAIDSSSVSDSSKINFDDGRIMLVAKGAAQGAHALSDVSSKNSLNVPRDPGISSQHSDRKLVLGYRTHTPKSTPRGSPGGLDGEGYKSSNLDISSSSSKGFVCTLHSEFSDMVEFPCESPQPQLTEEQVAMKALIMLKLIFSTIPESRRMLARRHPSMLRHLVQILVLRNDNIISEATIILKQLLEANKHLIPLLGQTGFFLFVMHNLVSGCSYATASLLNASHRHQTQPYSGSSFSALERFLPSPVLRQCKDAKSMHKILGGDHCSPNIVWTSTQRSELHRSLALVINPLRKALSKNPRLIFEADTTFDVQYPSISRELCVGDVYLNLMIQEPEHVLQDPDYVAAKLMGETSQSALKLRAAKKGSISEKVREEVRRHCLLIIKSQTHLRRKLFAECPSLGRYNAFTGLLSIMMQAGENGDSSSLKTNSEVQQEFELAHHAVMLVSHVLRGKEEGQKLALASENVQLFFAAEGIKKLTKFLLSLNVHTPNSAPIACCILSILQELSGQKEEIVNHAAASPNFLGWMINLLNQAYSLPATAISVLRLMARFTQSQRHPLLLEKMLQRGAFLHVMYLALFPSPELAKAKNHSASELSEALSSQSSLGSSKSEDPIGWMDPRVQSAAMLGGDDKENQNMGINLRPPDVKAEERKHKKARKALQVESRFESLRMLPEVATLVMHQMVAKPPQLFGFAESAKRSDKKLPLQQQTEKLRSQARRIFKLMLTSGLFRFVEMSKPTKPLHVEAALDHYTPTLIWNQELRSELKDYLHHEISMTKKNGSWNRWKEDFRFAHKALNSHLIVSDVYIKVLNKQASSYKLPAHVHPDELLKELIDHLNRFCKSCLPGWKTANSMLSDSKETKEGLQSEADPLVGVPDEPSQSQLNTLIDLLTAIIRLLRSYPKICHVYTKHMWNLPLLLAQNNCKLKQVVLEVIHEFSKEMVFSNLLHPHAHLLHAVLAARQTPTSQVPDAKLNIHLLAALCKDPIRGVRKLKSIKLPSQKHKRPIAKELVQGGLILTLAKVLIDRKFYNMDQRKEAAKLCGELCASAAVGKDASMILNTIFSWQIKPHLSRAVSRPEGLIDFIDDTVDSPTVYWTDEVREEIIGFISKEVAELRSHSEDFIISVQRGDPFPLPYTWHYSRIRQRFYLKTVQSRLYVGGIFVESLVNNPYFKLKTKSFTMELLAALQQRFDNYLSGQKDSKLIGEICLLIQALSNMVTNLPHMVEQLLKMDKLQLVYRFFWEDVTEMKMKSLALKLANSCAINDLAARHVAQQRLIRVVLPLLVTETDDLEQVINLILQHVRRSSAVVDQIRMMGGLVILGSMFVNWKLKNTLRGLVASLIGAMTNDAMYGQDITDMMCEMFTSKFRGAFQSSASIVLRFCDRDHLDSKGRYWNRHKRELVQAFLEKHAHALAPQIKLWNGTQELFHTDQLNLIWKEENHESKK